MRQLAYCRWIVWRCGFGTHDSGRRSAPLLLAPGEGDEMLREVAVDLNLRESLLKGVASSAISIFDLDGDGAQRVDRGAERLCASATF